MCDKEFLSLYGLNVKNAVIDNLTACKLNGIKIDKKLFDKKNCINIQIISNPNETINLKCNYILILQNYVNNTINIPNYTKNNVIFIKSEMLNNLIIYGNFTNSSTYVLSPNSSKQFVYSYSDGFWIVF